jgi:CubicO group peptidase (beta-lactamase class C family)
MPNSGASVLADQIDALVRAWRVPGAPGGVIAVIRDGAIVARRCDGFADLAHGVPITGATRIESMVFSRLDD